MNLTRFRFVSLFAAAALAACATSPTGRQQLLLFPDDVIDNLGSEAFADMRSKTPQVEDGSVRAYVSCVAEAVIARLPDGYAQQNWEVVVFIDESPNAFALPGGKIGVNSGMLDVAGDQHQLAAVIGHEIAHVVAKHANERMSSAYATSAGLEAVSGALGDASSGPRIMGLLGVGAQYGLQLPYNRQRESEADVLGLDFMVAAGFDPHASVLLWLNMADASPGSVPEFMSTHPSHETRISGLKHRAQVVMPAYEAARAAGHRPDCDRLR